MTPERLRLLLSIKRLSYSIYDLARLPLWLGGGGVFCLVLLEQFVSEEQAKVITEALTKAFEEWPHTLDLIWAAAIVISVYSLSHLAYLILDYHTRCRACRHSHGSHFRGNIPLARCSGHKCKCETYTYPTQ
jgi:hypothetical protein